MKERNLKDEFERLNIVSFDCAGFATKEDVFTAVDAVDSYIKTHSDDQTVKRIEQIIAEKKAARYKGSVAE